MVVFKLDEKTLFNFPGIFFLFIFFIFIHYYMNEYH